MELSSNTNSTLFRVGAVYRDTGGNVCRLLAGANAGVAISRLVRPEGHNDPTCDSECRLSDGTDPTGACFRLLPGELHQVNGEWVPMEAPARSIGAILREKLQQPAPAAAPEPNRPRLTWADPKPVDRFPGFICEYSVSGAEMYSGNMDHAHSSPLQRLGDTASPLHGSASLRED